MEYAPMLRVAILGPVSTTGRGEEAEQFMNLRRMCETANDIVRLGMAPYVPGLCTVWHMMQPMPREIWIALSQNEIRRSDACYRMAGASKGADLEIEFAEYEGIPIFYDLEALAEWGGPRCGSSKERDKMFRDFERLMIEQEDEQASR